MRCQIHPLAEIILFEHKRELSKVFREVIGLCEIDHISITLINNQHELIFLSYTPSIEYNLLTTGLWIHDLSYHQSFYEQLQAKLWSELYGDERQQELKYLKQIKTGLHTGISIPKKFNNINIMYAFATKNYHADSAEYLLSKTNNLLSLGDYCFNKLSQTVIPCFMDINKQSILLKPKSLYLIKY